MSDSATTLFVDNLPISIRKIWIHNLFVRFGKVSEIFIPNKWSKITKQQFGFVNFRNRKDAILAIANTNGHWVLGSETGGTLCEIWGY